MNSAEAFTRQAVARVIGLIQPPALVFALLASGWALGVEPNQFSP